MDHHLTKIAKLKEVKRSIPGNVGASTKLCICHAHTCVNSCTPYEGVDGIDQLKLSQIAGKSKKWSRKCQYKVPGTYQ